MFFVAVVRSWR